jgi:hypothetical protein
MLRPLDHRYWPLPHRQTNSVLALPKMCYFHRPVPSMLTPIRYTYPDQLSDYQTSVMAAS